MAIKKNLKKYIDEIGFNPNFCDPSLPLKNRQSLLVVELIRCYDLKITSSSSAPDDHRKFVRAIGTYIKLMNFFVKEDANPKDRATDFGADRFHFGRRSPEHEVDQEEVELKLLEFTLAQIKSLATSTPESASDDEVNDEFSIADKTQYLISELTRRYQTHFPSPLSNEDRKLQRKFSQDLLKFVADVQRKAHEGVIKQKDIEPCIRQWALVVELRRQYHSTFTSVKPTEEDLAAQHEFSQELLTFQKILLRNAKDGMIKQEEVEPQLRLWAIEVAPMLAKMAQVAK
ncbi:hypothetical protein GLAREA_07021 [Glarea lozoyensis ATCC 20868]|uniref:Uncharacterized protein n=1 Tax=Glarea lozoyensis (strain ATCC 20868 / MF5171) TaxID=1116229 RepID=S3E6J7_GLAL2|nr:uncharacterized protein GLAREA_07021 [Glarea lozoyensis ATCC 20868]EPE34008.1 hypothetical protein GLAREA_07021 [Glarea lozoyensis ATCC 20868]